MNAPVLTQTTLLWPRELRGPERVGFKPYRQAVLLERGLPVPPFACLPREVFERWLAPHEDEVRRRLSALDLSQGDAPLAELRAWLAAQPLPPGLAGELEQAAERIAGPEGLLAVRGSLVSRGAAPDEDGEQALEGASASLLEVHPRDVADAAREVWLGAWSLPAVVYRGVDDPLGHSVAVQLQRLVQAERSFVAFTRDPVHGEDHTVVASAEGFGEGIVAELAEVDHDFLDPAGELVRREPRGERSLLDLDELRWIAILARQAEQVFSAPQDVEGCLDAEGRTWVVQSRPLAPPDRRTVFDDSNVSESYPGRTTPLTFGFARRFYRDIFADCLRRLGVPAARLNELRPDFERMIGFLDGRIYYRLDSFYELFDAHPLFALYRPHWERTIGLQRSGRDAPLRAPGALERAGSAANLAWNFARHRARMREFYAEFERELSDLRALPETSDPLELCDRAERFSTRCFRRWGLTLVNDAFLILAHGTLERLAERWDLCRERPGLLNELLAGEEGVTSAEVVQSAVALSELVGADPALAHALAEVARGERDAAALWRELPARAPGFAAACQEHLRRYGARGPGDLELERPSPREQPGELLQAVARYAAEGIRLAELSSQEQALRAGAEAELRRRLRGRPGRRLVVQRLLAIVREGIRQRERSRYCRSELFAACRELYLRAGQSLARQRVLERGDDVFWLTPAELSAAAAGTSVDADLRPLVARRRAEQRDLPSRAPSRVETLGAVAARRWVSPPEEVASDAAAEDGVLLGLGSCAGVVRGRARVLSEPEPWPPGEDTILVARETDPGWLFVMLGAKGMVVERGSLLSHTAIAGRTFGIPTVVGVPNATTRIRDGEWLEVDGALGRVRQLDERPPSA
ncbi:MAG TPA: hypothetical protein DEA08_34050 [Planctomycetes bacterium]|nr:hypothetical protein [Planctomycetota bacterium]